MKTKARKPDDDDCQLFEFLLRTTRGVEAFAYALTLEGADRLARLFGPLNPLDPDCRFVEFSLTNGRLVYLNLHFLVAVSRLDLVGRAKDQEAPSVTGQDETEPYEETGGGDRPDVEFWLDGLEATLCCQELERDQLELTAMILQEEPAHGVVSFFDAENLRTRFIPARKVILLESRAWHPEELSDAPPELP